MDDPTSATIGGAKNIERLDQDYATWKAQMEALLIREDLWEVIEFPAPPGPTAPETEQRAWLRQDRRARATIMLYLMPEHYETVDEYTSAHGTWHALRQQFEQVNNARLGNLMQDFANLKLTQAETVTHYVGRAKRLRKQLLGAGQSTREDVLVTQTLNGLPQDYATTSDSLRAHGSQVTWATAVPLLLAVENRIKGAASAKSEDTASAYEAKGPTSRRGRRSSIECYYSHDLGHIKHDCEKLKASKARAAARRGGRYDTDKGSGSGGASTTVPSSRSGADGEFRTLAFRARTMLSAHNRGRPRYSGPDYTPPAGPTTYLLEPTTTTEMPHWWHEVTAKTSAEACHGGLASWQAPSTPSRAPCRRTSSARANPRGGRSIRARRNTC